VGSERRSDNEGTVEAQTHGLPGRHSGGTKLWLIGRHSGGKVENVSEKRARVRPFLWVKLKF